MTITSELKKGAKKVGKTIAKAGQDTVTFAENIDSNKDDRASKCFDVLKQNNIQVCSKDSGEHITLEKFKEVSHIPDRFSGNFDLDNCLKSLEGKGFVDCNKLGEHQEPVGTTADQGDSEL